MENDGRSTQRKTAGDLRGAAESILSIHHMKLVHRHPLAARMGPFVIELTTPFNSPATRVVELPSRNGMRLRTIPAPVHPYELTIWMSNRVLCLGWRPDRNFVILHFFRGEWENLFFRMASEAWHRHTLVRRTHRPYRTVVPPVLWTPGP